jgi:hypothetical protein
VQNAFIQYQRDGEAWKSYAKAEDEKFLKAHPEYADGETRGKIANAVLRTAEGAGIPKEHLLKAYTGQLKFDLRSAAAQEILLKAALYDEARANVAKPAPKPVPPVQRPGVAAANRFESGEDENIAALTRKLDRTGSLKDAAALRLAKMRAAARG